MKVRSEGCFAGIPRRNWYIHRNCPELKLYDLDSACYIQIRFEVALDMGVMLSLTPGDAIVAKQVIFPRAIPQVFDRSGKKVLYQNYLAADLAGNPKKTTSRA